jgi:hypothetical protein
MISRRDGPVSGRIPFSVFGNFRIYDKGIGEEEMAIVSFNRKGKGLGFRIVLLDMKLPHLKAAKDYATTTVKQSEPVEMLQATVLEDKRIKYECHIDADGKFRETIMV